jgi:hypothetical protein
MVLYKKFVLGGKNLWLRYVIYVAKDLKRVLALAIHTIKLNADGYLIYTELK